MPLPMACKGIVKVQLRIGDNHSRSFTGADVTFGGLQGYVAGVFEPLRTGSEDVFWETRWIISANTGRMLPEYRSILGVTGGSPDREP